MSQPFSGSSVLPAAAGISDCWNRIGTSGDRSCPELATHVHCRNCPVFAAAARTFLDRPAPEGYLEEWTRWLAGSGTGPADGENRDVVSVLIFRLGQEWLAFRTTTVAEVTLPRPVHRVPHRTSEVLIGLVNLRGQLQLCVSLHGLLGVSPADSADHASTMGSGPPSKTRLIVLRDCDRSVIWVFPVEEVLGVHRLPRAELLGVSSSLANVETSFSQAILRWQGHDIGLLDEQRVFAALGSIGQ